MEFLEIYKKLNFSQKVAAIFCVYEDSGYLEEAIWRAYPFVDLVIISIGKRPWSGQAPDWKCPSETMSKCASFFDPQKKIEIHYRDFEDEASQRNWEKEYCYKNGYEWILIIDDDEFYNPKDIVNLRKSINETKDLVVLVPQRVYWKTKEYVINNIVMALPVGVKSDMQRAWFSVARNVLVKGGGWYTHPSHHIVYHHLSYARTDEQLLSKVKNFSHAGDHDFADWYENFWLKWTPESTNFHPNPGSRASFEKAVPTSTLPESEKLQECGMYPSSNFYKNLKQTDLIRVPKRVYEAFSQKGLQSFIYKLSVVLGADSDKAEEISNKLNCNDAINSANFFVSTEDCSQLSFKSDSIYAIPLTDDLYKKICFENFNFCLMPYWEQPFVVIETRLPG